MEVKKNQLYAQKINILRFSSPKNLGVLKGAF